MNSILIVEDDPILLRLYINTLSRSSFTVTSANNAAEAFTSLATSKPNLVILDVMLPGGKNGFDVLEEMKSNPAYATIPVIISTNLDSEKEIAIEIGASDYIVKSNTPMEELVVKINKILTNPAVSL
jgi:DNA-binding response OmpR family regulator